MNDPFDPPYLRLDADEADLRAYLERLVQYIGPTPAQRREPASRSARIRARRGTVRDAELRALDPHAMTPRARDLLWEILERTGRTTVALRRFPRLRPLRALVEENYGHGPTTPPGHGFVEKKLWPDSATGGPMPTDPPVELSADSHRRRFADLRHGLDVLDDVLSAFDPPLAEPVPIRAIGGFALLYHGIRRPDNATTVDIDTLTATPEPRVRAAIRAVAERLDLDADWINNTAVFDGDVELARAIVHATWGPRLPGLRMLDVRIADEPTLLRSKIVAVEDVAVSGRDRDLADLEDLMARLGLGPHDLALACPEMDEDTCRRATEAVLAHRWTTGTAPAPTSRQDAAWDNDLDVLHDILDEDYRDVALGDVIGERWDADAGGGDSPDYGPSF